MGIAFANGMVVTLDNLTLIIAETRGARLTAFDITAETEGGVCLVPVDGAQIVDHVAAPNNEHTPFAKRSQLRTQLEVVVKGLQRINRQLDYGDIGVR
jgi:hypothetical protein